MTGTFFRGQLIVSMIPREPGGITTREIHERLKDRHEIDVSLRRVQADLSSIRMIYPLESTSESSPRHYWPSNAPIELVPGHDDYTALTWNLLEAYLQPLIPASMAGQVQPVFDTARRYLEEAGRNQISEWRKRVRMIPRAFALRPPDIAEEVQREVYEALWDGEELKVSYRRRGNEAARELALHPQALVVREGVFYLLALVNDYDDIRHFALHRIESASNQYREARRVEDFNLDAYIAEGGFAYVEGGEIDLVLRFDPYVGQHLLETGLSDDQQISTLDDDRIEVRARMLDTQQLRWWILGFGASVEVMFPDHMRKYISSQVTCAARLYNER